MHGHLAQHLCSSCWRTKAPISLKRVKIEEKLLWRAYRKSPTLFRTMPSGQPPLPRDWGSQQPHPKTAIAIISETAKAIRTANLADTFVGSIRTQAHKKFWRKESVGVSRDSPNFFEYPLLSQERVKLRTSSLAGIFTGSMRTKAFKKFGE